jgi:hypothetical protein
LLQEAFMGRVLFLTAIVASSIALGSCAVDNEDTFKTTGTVALREDVFGDFRSFYFIAADDGSQYYPINLPDRFQLKGVRVRFEARILPRSKPIVGWGNSPVIEIVQIQEISP